MPPVLPRNKRNVMKLFQGANVMLKFKDFGILWKFLSLIGLLSLVTLGGTVYATYEMRYIDNSYGDLLDGFGKGNLAMARANRNLVYVNRSIYRLLTETTEDGKKDANQEITDNVGYFQKQIKAAMRSLPAQSKQIAAIGDKLTAVIEGECADVIQQGNSLAPGAAKTAIAKMQSTCNPALNTAMTDISGLTNQLLKLSDAAGDQTLALTNTTIFDSYLFILSGLSVLAGFAAYVTRQSISKPITVIADRLEKLSLGDTTIDFPGADRKDEVGVISRTAVRFRDQLAETELLRANQDKAAAEEAERTALNAQERARAAEEQASVVRQLGHGLKRLAEGDLTVHLDEGFTDAYIQIRDDFNEAIDRLKEVIQSVISSANTIQAGTEDIEHSSDDLARRTSQQASTLEETAAALDQITETVKKSAAGATNASTVVASVDGDARSSAVVMRQAIEAMDSIANSGREIAQVIGVIDEIAFQTNLLALNAGVEAARAGDAGRGFAVVASEVRLLAQRSAEASKEIKGLIATSIEHVDRGVDLIAATGKSLERITQRIGEINTIVAGIADGSQDQAHSLVEINTAMTQMDEVTQENAAMVEQSAAANSALSKEALALAELVSRFQVDEGDYTDVEDDASEGNAAA